VLGDFGLLKRVTDVSEQDRELLKESAGVGMPFFYRSPDLVAYSRNEASITTKSDIFQLGLVLAELFTGRNPAIAPEGGDPLSDVKLERIRQVPSGHAGLIVPNLDKMLELDPEKRPTAAELLDYWDGAFQVYARLARELNGTTL
jgi:serine/threonine protein kinase